MELKTVLFYAFATVLVLAALKVITSKNPVHAALFLVLAFFTAGAEWLLLSAETLAFFLVVVYVGAVMVLFLFVVMMLDINIDRLREGFWSYLPLGLITGGVMAAEMAALLYARFAEVKDGDVPAAAANASNIKALGTLMYTDYVFPVELASIVLLVAIVAAVALTYRGPKKTKYTDPSKQVFVKAKDRLRVVKMDAEKKEG